MVVYHCRSVWLFLIQSVRGAVMMLLVEFAASSDRPSRGLAQAVARHKIARKVPGCIFLCLFFSDNKILPRYI